jgi:hypothetical protein
MLLRMCTTKLLTDGTCSLNNNGDVVGVHWKCNVFLSRACHITTIIHLSQINAASTTVRPLLLIRLRFILKNAPFWGLLPFSPVEMTSQELVLILDIDVNISNPTFIP